VRHRTIKATRRALFCFAIALLPTLALTEEDYPPNRAYAVRSETLSIIDEDTFQSLGTRALPEGKVVFSWMNADKSRLGLILQDGLIGNLPVSLVVVDLANDKIVNTVKLGYDASRFLTSEDGSRAYMLPGGKVFRGESSVIAVDIAGGTVVAQAEIRRAPDDLFLADGDRKVVFVRKGLNALKASQRRPARLEPLEALDLPGPIRSMYLDDPGRVYFLNRGFDHQNKKHRAQGELYVVDRGTLELKATLEVGMAPGQLALDAEREMFFLLTSPWATQKKAAAQLHLIGADGIAASIDLPRRPLGAQPSQERRHFYVLHGDDIVRVDHDLKQAQKSLSLKDSPVQLFEHPDSGFFYALHYDGLMTVADGELLCTISPGNVRLFDIAGGFELKAQYDGVFSDVTEVPGKRKLYLSQELGRPVSVVDLDEPGEGVRIPGTAGKVIRPTVD
jgi:hypothetical protein